MPKASQYKGYTAYFVNVIPKKPQRYDLAFEPSDKETGNKCRANESIRIIDGASFYSLVTGKDSALREFYQALPVVIEAIFQNDYQEVDFCFPDRPEFERYFNAAYGSAAAQNQFDF